MRHHSVDCLALFNTSQAANRAINEPTPEPETPAWLPEGAVAFTGFIDENAYADGAETTLATIIGNDPNVDNALGSTTFDPEWLTAAGLEGEGPRFAFLGAMRTAITSGCTIV